MLSPCSVELLALLKWRSCPETLLVTLNGIEHVSGNEIFKFLQDTLDCLFQILTEHEGKYKKELFNVLVRVNRVLEKLSFNLSILSLQDTHSGIFERREVSALPSRV